MSRIEHVDLSYRVYQTIKEMIFTGELAPGQKILQEKLAEEIGVSRTPLLKALQMLEHEFLVEPVPRRGMFVKKMSMKELLDAFDCRIGLEGTAARLVTERASDAGIQSLKKLFLPFQESESIDAAAYKKADQTFHNQMIKLSENRILAKLEMLGNIIFICNSMGLVRQPKETVNEHFQLIEAMEARDAALAEKRAKAHLEISRDRIAKELEKQ